MDDLPQSSSLQAASGRSELRNVIAMAVPVVITTSARAMMDVADYVMVSMLPGRAATEAQAAILPAQVLMWSFLVLGMGIGAMISTFAAQCLGRGEHRESSAYAWQSLYLGVVFGVLGSLLIPLAPVLVGWVGHEPSVQAAEIAYLQVAALTAGPTIASNGLGLYFIGIHRPWVTTWSAIEANVVNIVVSYVLIFGYLGFEPMGIAGAAAGTVAAITFRTVRLAVMLWLPSVHAQFGSRDSWRPSWQRLWRLIRYGTPLGFQWVSEVVVWAIFVNVLIGRMFGTAELIATNTAWQYLRVAFLPCMGVGQALTALVGRSIGAGQPERAIREARIAGGLTVGYMGALAIVYGVFGRELVGLFSDDPAVLRIGAGIMICAGVFQLFDGLSITYTSALRGAGDTFIPSIFFVISTWAIIVGGGWLMVVFVPQWRSFGPWIAAAALIIVTAFFLWWRWHERAWMKIDLFGDEARGRPA
jgi:MATE family multidrug resistance protein